MKKQLGNNTAKRLFTLKKSGVTLIELTVVILVLLTLISILFFGAQAWKDGVARSTCVLNLRQVQLAVRSHQNMFEVETGTPLLRSDIFGPGRAIELLPGCPDSINGAMVDNGYVFPSLTVPALGTLYMQCNLRPRGHHPAVATSW